MFLPIASISRILKKAIPANGKIAKNGKETVQECVSEFISFITSEYVYFCYISMATHAHNKKWLCNLFVNRFRTPSVLEVAVHYNLKFSINSVILSLSCLLNVFENVTGTMRSQVILDFQLGTILRIASIDVCGESTAAATIDSGPCSYLTVVEQTIWLTVAGGVSLQGKCSLQLIFVR